MIDTKAALSRLFEQLQAGEISTDAFREQSDAVMKRAAEQAAQKGHAEVELRLSPAARKALAL